MKLTRVYAVVGLAMLVSIGVFSLGFHRRPCYIRNFEEEEYGREHPFVKPVSTDNGLAVYAVGTVVTFDVPVAYRSTRDPKGDMAELLSCT